MPDGCSVRAKGAGGVALGKEALKLGDEWKMKVACSKKMVCGIASNPPPGGFECTPDVIFFQ